VFHTAERRHFAEKLGISELREDEIASDGSSRLRDSALVEELFELLTEKETDYSIFFRQLAEARADAGGKEPTDGDLLAPLEPAFYDPEGAGDEHRRRLAGWLRRYVRRVREDGTRDDERRRRMNLKNPKYVLRNYVAQLAIDRAEAGDPELVREVLDCLRRPFDEQPEREELSQKRPDWARHRAGCSMLSCSS
jgi:uncharacterized protein YdiU (UPF0061 family)